MKKNLLIFLMIFAFQLSFFSQLDLHGQETIFLFTFDETPLTPFELNVNEDLGYSIDDDFVVDSALSLTGITIPASDPVAEGIQVSHWPTQLETDLFYGFSFTGSAASERTAHLFIGTDDRGTAFLDTTITINVTEEDYYFEFLMEGVTTDSALISLELGLSDVSTTLDDFVFEKITRWGDSEPDIEDIIWQVRPDKYNLDHSTVEWLRSEGYSVFVDTTDAYFDKELTQLEIDELNAAKLIIISPNAGSFDYKADEVGIGMAEVTTPVLCQSSYVVRGSKMNFFNSEDRGNIPSSDFYMTGIDPGLMQAESALIDTNAIGYIIPEGTENYTNLADPLDNGEVIFAEFEACVEAYEGGYTPGGHWVFFGPRGQKEDAISFTEEGKVLYMNLMEYLITMPASDNCSPPPPAVSEIRDTIIFSDVTNDPLEPVVLDVKDGYEVDDTYEYVLDGELIIDPVTIPASPQNAGIQLMYGPVSVKPNRVYNLSFLATAENLRNAHILMGTKESPGLILDIPFVMLNTPQKYEFEFAAEEAFITDSAYFYLELGASDISARIDSIGMTEGFPDVEEECFVFEAEDFSDQELFPPFEVFDDTDACGGQYVMATEKGSNTEPVETGRIAFEFEVKKRAAFVIWFRVIAPSKTDDSFWWAMDGVVGRNNLIEGSTEWIWDQVKQEEGPDIDPFIFDLRPGKHVFEIIRREDGTQLDKLFITNQLSTVPEGCEVCDSGSTNIQLNPNVKEQDVNIYPNPANHQITIETNDEKPGILRIFNISGKLEMTRQIEMRTTMDVSNLGEGLYIFEYASDKKVSRQTIIID